ncbi:hypothetical protein AB205_0085060 [Aquarana catesbeiana]|uniref:Uncharacterized protein n=1 Tax=Aquarana catesbeiana TaxID=8400 RepID=A0A2G9Q147_AQUCT|nr:hypothetical protein AB205_0085060 [Aquarana catesbeiana]
MIQCNVRTQQLFPHLDSRALVYCVRPENIFEGNPHRGSSGYLRCLHLWNLHQNVKFCSFVQSEFESCLKKYFF